MNRAIYCCEDIELGEEFLSSAGISPGAFGDVRDAD